MLSIGLEATANDVKAWIERRDQSLVELGIAPNQSSQAIANALFEKFKDDENLLQRFNSSLNHRGTIYDQVNDRPELEIPSYIFALTSAANAAAAIAEGGLISAFWPGIAQVVLLIGAGLWLCFRRPASPGPGEATG